MVPIISNFQTMHNPNYPDTTSPIVLKVYFDGANQFVFKFKAPITSTLQINDGDGTLTPVAGNDATTVTHTTSYPTNKTRTFYFYVEGDYEDITLISLFNITIVAGSVSRWNEITSLENIQLQGATGMYGNLEMSFATDNLVYINTTFNKITGDISLLQNSSLDCLFNKVPVTGDLSTLQGSLIGLTPNAFIGTLVTFDNIVNWTIPGTFYAYDNNWTSAMVDNALISFANGGTTGKTINIAGNNASRTTASDAAKATLLANGNTLTVNE